MKKDKYPDFSIFNSKIGAIYTVRLPESLIHTLGCLNMGSQSTDYIPWDHHINYSAIQNLNFSKCKRNMLITKIPPALEFCTPSAVKTREEIEMGTEFMHHTYPFSAALTT